MTRQYSDVELELINAYCDAIDAAAAVAAEIRWFAPKVREPLAFSINEHNDLIELADSIHNLSMLNPGTTNSGKMLADCLERMKDQQHYQVFHCAPVASIRANIDDSSEYRTVYLFNEGHKRVASKYQTSPFHFYPKSAVKVLHQFTGRRDQLKTNRMDLLDRLIGAALRFEDAANACKQQGIDTSNGLFLVLERFLYMISGIATEIRIYGYKYRSGAEPLRSNPDFNELDDLCSLIVTSRSITSSIRSLDPLRIYSTANGIINLIRPYLKIHAGNAFAKPDLMSTAYCTPDNRTAHTIRLYADNGKLPKFIKNALRCNLTGKVFIEEYSVFETLPMELYNRIYHVKAALIIMNMLKDNMRIDE